ncbi:MAG: 16S rRNA (guanine(527)-N(7))-methyltransferase RsmG [Lachnospiraceae bacterium]|nr:16S rRNA (guanine(527)-N(7))-methyltransferase RsmG [Lachnospiraceae bacterium]
MNQNDKNTISYETLPLTGEQRKLFDQLILLLDEKNRQVNLTAITDPQEIREKHFADSLAVCLCKEAEEKMQQGAKVLDLGTGGGFPALPIKIVYPDTEMTMLDATAKKLAALDEMSDALGLKNAVTCWGRAEELAHQPEYRAYFNMVVSRAAMYLPALIECAVPFLKEGGMLIAYKQGSNDDEIVESAHALDELNAEITGQVLYSIGGDARRLIMIEKTGPTPDKYPRRPGKPTKNPL